MAVISASKVQEEEETTPEHIGASEAADGGPGRAPRGRWSRRRSGAIAGALALVCATVAYGVYGSSGGGDSGDDPPARAVPTVGVTYEVTGEGPAEITFRPAGGTAPATVVRDAALPWRTSVRLPAGTPPTVSIVLGERGTTATCTVTVGGEHVQRAVAMGSYGRTTCGGEGAAAGR
ncbi:hypothetical protein AB0G74_20865 [Streptomyces sp. NPDC020875]|uniref:hypothetical protein n=1 Tax=Streptomyces sp. NPDC020875 TaxID=3154898 RepID=UPI0033E39230